MAARGTILMQYVPPEMYRGADDPDAPEDGQLVYNSTENVLKRWDAALGEAGEYVIVADYNTMTGELGAIQDATTGNATFLGLLASAEYTVDGLKLTGIGGTLQLLLGPSRISFIEGGEEVAYVTGNKLYIMSAELVAEMKIGNYFVKKTADGGLVFM